MLSMRNLRLVVSAALSGTGVHNVGCIVLVVVFMVAVVGVVVVVVGVVIFVW